MSKKHNKSLFNHKRKILNRKKKIQNKNQSGYLLGIGPHMVNSIEVALREGDDIHVRKIVEGLDEYELAKLIEVLDFSSRKKLIEIFVFYQLFLIYSIISIIVFSSIFS